MNIVNHLTMLEDLKPVFDSSNHKASLFRFKYIALVNTVEENISKTQLKVQCKAIWYVDDNKGSHSS